MTVPEPSVRGKQATIGVIMLDTAFERFVGDIGNPESLPFPVLYRTVPGASAAAITALTDDRFLDPFIATAEALIADGADGIMTSCGFLALYQGQMAERLSVPVATSALLQVPMVQRLLPRNRQVGVVTFNATTLGAPHLEAAGASTLTPVVGLLEHGAFRRAILGDATGDSFYNREREAILTAQHLVATHPNVGAIVLECTNLVPHAAAIYAATGLPVYDVMTLALWFQAGLRPKSWA